MQECCHAQQRQVDAGVMSALVQVQLPHHRRTLAPAPREVASLQQIPIIILAHCTAANQTAAASCTLTRISHTTWARSALSKHTLPAALTQSCSALIVLHDQWHVQVLLHVLILRPHTHTHPHTHTQLSPAQRSPYCMTQGMSQSCSTSQ